MPNSYFKGDTAEGITWTHIQSNMKPNNMYSTPSKETWNNSDDKNNNDNNKIIM